MQFLNIAYTKYNSNHEAWRNGLFSASIVLLIFLLFQPFGFRGKDLELKLFLYPLYGLIAFCYSNITFRIVRHVLLSKKIWTIKNELLSLAIGMVPVTFFVHLGTYWITDDMPFNLYWYFKLLYHILSLFLVIATIEYLFYSNKSADLRIEHLSSQIQLYSRQINGTNSNDYQKLVLISLEKDSLEINRNKIVFIQSNGNYLEFFLRETDGKIKKLVKRGRIHQVEKDLENCLEFFRCHWAFIVNLKHAKQIKGNNKNARLVFNDTTHEVPVSRLNFKTLKEQLDKIIVE